MTNPVIYPANLQWAAFAEETAYGTPAATPLYYVPLSGPKWAPHETQIQNDAYYGDMAEDHGMVPGVRYDTFDYSTFMFLDTAYPHMLAILGAPDTLTGSSDPYTHKTSLYSKTNGQPVSWTVWMSNGAECWVMAGCQMASLDLETKVADSLATLTVQWMGLPATTTTAPTFTPETGAPEPSWATTVTIGGTATANYTDVKISWKRNAAAVYGANNAQAPYVIFMGGLSVEIDLTAIYTGYAGTVSDLHNYLTNVQPSVVVKIAPVGDVTHYLQFTGSVMAYQSDGVAITDNGQYLEAAIKATVQANTTDTLSAGGGMSPGQVIALTPKSSVY